MTYYQVGEVALRSENVDRMIKNIAARKYVLKAGVVSVVNSNAWAETFYRESIKSLGAKQGIPRLAEFPQDNVDWEKATSRMQKFGLESDIPWEDAMTDKIDVVARTLFRVGNRIAQLVDTHIWDTISENRAVANINSLTIAAGAEWDHVTRSNRIPHEQIAKAIQTITNSDLQAYTPDTIIVNPYEYIYLITNDYVLDSFDASGPAVMSNGNMGRLLGLKVLVTPSATTDYAMVLQAKICATYRQAEDLRTATIREEGKKHTIRAWEIGTCQMTDPKAICLITNTKQ